MTIIKPSALKPNGCEGLTASQNTQKQDREKLWLNSPRCGISSASWWHKAENLSFSKRCRHTVLLYQTLLLHCSACSFTAHTSFFCTHSEAKYRIFCMFYFMYAGHIASQRSAATFEQLLFVHNKANTIKLEDFLSCLMRWCLTDLKHYCHSCFISASYLLVII